MLKKYQNEILLFLLLIVGAVLRFYHFFQLPFTWDELSAWSRLQFDNFPDLIEYGIKPDGHPAGVQVFLFYWTWIFGNQEWVVKLPFNLMGLASIFIFYKIGKIWWNESVGLIAAAFMSSLQFFVLYSPIARPYSSGLFLTLMMVLYWSLYFFKSAERKYLLGFVIFASLSSYNHHFTLLMAAIVGISGLTFVKKENLKDYIWAGLAIFILYLPHLPIFFHQLGIGGIGGDGNWLSKPADDFPLQYILWSFHFSSWIIALVILIIIIGIFTSAKKQIPAFAWRKRLILLLWFALPLAIGFFYSIIINPVIQYSMLIFSYPFFLLLIFSGLAKLHFKVIAPLLIVILTLNIFSLINSRQHYQIIFKQPFDGTARSLKKLNNPNDCFLLHNYIPSYQQYYLNKYHLENISSYSIYDQKMNLKQIDSILRNIQQKNIICSALPEDMVQLVHHHFPYLIQRENGYTYESYLFSKNKSNSIPFHELISEMNLLSPSRGWQIQQNRIFLDSTNKAYYQFLPNQEWGFTFSDSLQFLLQEQNEILDLEADIISEDSVVRATWVATIKNKSQEPVWRGQNLDKNLIKTPLAYKLYFSVDSRINSKSEFNKSLFSTYFWNKNQNGFLIQNIKIYSRKQNPIKYSLFEKH